MYEKIIIYAVNDVIDVMRRRRFIPQSQQLSGIGKFYRCRLLVGACLGFIYAIMPRIDIITGTKITSCEKKTSCVIGGAVITACVAFLAGLCYFS